MDRAAGRASKSKVLDEFVAVTGLYRQYAMRTLRKAAPTGRTSRTERRIYTEAVRTALIVLWESKPRPFPIPDAEAPIASTCAVIRIQGDSAHHTPSTDTITMPDRERFFATDTASAEQNWYAILLHELVHNAVPRIMPHSAVVSRISGIW